MKTSLCLAALAAAAACAAASSHAATLEKALMTALGDAAALPRAHPPSKLTAFLSSLQSTLGPVAAEARAAGFTPSRGAVGPKPWSPMPPSYYAMIPVFLGAVGGSANANSTYMTFKSRCNRTTTVKAVVGATETKVVFSAGHSPDLLCEDVYLLGTVNQLAFLSISDTGLHNVSVPVTDTPAGSAAWTAREGVRVMGFLQDALTAIVDLVDTVGLFIPSETSGPAVPPSSIPRSLDFQHSYVGNMLPPAGAPGKVTDINPDDIPTGSILAILRLDGLAGLEDWGTGAHTDHIAMAFRWDNGTLMVVESTDTTAYWTHPNIQMHTWEEWLPLAAAADFNIMLLAPSDATLAAFDSAKAQAFVEASLGLPYGYHNFIFGFVDRVDPVTGVMQNLPYPATWQALEVIFGVIGGFDPAIAEKMWTLALNFHGGTQGLNTAQLGNAAAAKGMTFGELMAVPEQDSWVYPDGPSMVCDVFACSIYKHGGVFGELADGVTCTEFTNLDLYNLGVFNATGWDHVPACAAVSGGRPYCQLMGEHAIELNGFNSVPAYDGMFRHCGVLPPDFQRLPAGC